MADGIVSRLRESADGWDLCSDAENAALDREAADEIERLRVAMLDILRTFRDGSRGAYKARYFSVLGIARRALRAKGMKIGYDNVIALLEAEEDEHA
jgi:hypothetical protein